MKPDPAAGPAATQNRAQLSAAATVHVRGQVIPLVGFFAKALSGKTRSAPREPDRTHYGCSCCRWTA